eukprot:401921_1
MTKNMDTAKSITVIIKSFIQSDLCIDRYTPSSRHLCLSSYTAKNGYHGCYNWVQQNVKRHIGCLKHHPFHVLLSSSRSIIIKMKEFNNSVIMHAEIAQYALFDGACCGLASKHQTDHIIAQLVLTGVRHKHF